MPLPLLQSYNEPKIDKAYRLYMGGMSQRSILAKVKGLSQRTLARYCKNDGWEAERKAHAVVSDSPAESPNVAAVAAEVAAPAAKPQAPAAKAEADDGAPRNVRMERMLDRQQRIVARLVVAFEADVEKTLADAETTGKQPTRSQIAQLTSLGNNLLSMERKAWCVPDKIETNDTTPAPPDPIRNLTDEQLDRELAAERVADGSAAERAGAAATEGAEPKESVN